MSHDKKPGQTPAHRHEETDISIRRVLAWGVVLAGVIVGSMAVVWVMLTVFFTFAEKPGQARRSTRPDADSRPAAPRLQADPAQDLAVYRASENKILTEYAWIDKQNGIVRIPVAQAMKIVAASNLPVRTAPKKAAAAPAAAPENPS